MSAPGALLVHGGEVLSPDGCLVAADVLIRDGAIESVGALGGPDGVPVLDASGCIVAPGLVNAHMHSGENFNPGLYENLPLDLWFLHSHQVTRDRPPEADEIYVRTALGALLMLRSGTTCVADFVFEAPEITLETLEPIVRAYRDLGIRATVILGVADKPFLASLPLEPAERAEAPREAPVPSASRILEVAEAAVDRWHEPGGLTSIGLGPSAPQRCSDELFEGTLTLAHEHGLVWQTHALETKTQAYTARSWHGQSFVELLGERGQLGPRAALVHAIWLTDRDIEILADTGTAAVHCLMSNLRLGDGIARLAALRRAGVRTVLGTDGRGCHETLDMIELVRMTALVHKASGEEFELWPSAADVLAMATSEASRCVGHGDRLGRVEPGACGDLVLFGRDSLSLRPLHDPIRQLVYGSTTSDIRAVLVAGRVVFENGRFPGVDVEALLARADAYARSALEPSRPQDLSRLARIVRGVYERAERADLGVDRYIGSDAERRAPG